MAITFTNVSFAYPSGWRAVDDVSFTVRPGERLAIVGQNGAGKTTTVKLMNGLLKPTSGTVTVDGVTTAERTTASIAATVGYVFQNPDDQIFASTVRDELEYMPRYRKWDDAKRDERVARAARLGGIERYFDSNPNDLPLVIRKFVAIAAVLVGECKYIVLDEPTAGLDRPGQRRLVGLIDQLESEGVVQILRNDIRGDGSPVMAAVGPMQFEVVAARMKAEFNVEARMEPLGYALARRTDAESAVELGRQRGVEVFTRNDGVLLALFSDKWRLQYIEKELPALTLEPLVATAASVKVRMAVASVSRSNE